VDLHDVEVDLLGQGRLGEAAGLPQGGETLARIRRRM
jgi:hypothetical protein